MYRICCHNALKVKQRGIYHIPGTPYHMHIQSALNILSGQLLDAMDRELKLRTLLLLI